MASETGEGRVKAVLLLSVSSRLTAADDLLDFHLVLVHGTGAPGADWTQPEKSALCKHLRHVFGPRISFSSPLWDGANTHTARVNGATILRTHLEALESDGRPVFSWAIATAAA